MTSDSLWHLLLALAAVVTLGRMLGALFRRIHQPPVIAEVIAGLVLGPSLLGRVAPDAYRYILPSDVAPFLGVLAQFGIILYMFLVGVELNPERLRGRLRAAVIVSQASILLPLVLGVTLALSLHPRFAPADVPVVHFALFLGIAMSITAFPVLARILADRGMTRTKLGALALTCAAINDVTAWCLLAFVVGVVNATGRSVGGIVVMTVAFIAFMFLIARPFFVWLSGRTSGSESDPTRGAVGIALASVLVAALATEAIGIHAIFGAFLLGAVIPHDSTLARVLTVSLSNVVTILMLPAFFALTGMQTRLGLLTGRDEWIVCFLIIVVATAGKFGATLLAGRVTGLRWRSAAGLGVLMNTRGLMELIVLNVGLNLGVISPALFTMMVLMALATTLATTPLLGLLGIREMERA